SDADNSYRCTAKHRLTGQVKTSATAGKLFVTESQGNVPAKILDSEKIVSAVVNGQAILSCVGQGHPPPAIKWFEKNEDGKLLPLTVDDRMKTTPLALIIRVVKETDSGVYVCLAENIAGSERKELTLNVKKPMEITLNAKNIKLESTEKQNLVCDIKATSDFTISWYRNGHLMPRNAGIRKLILDKSGIYQCFAQSEDEMVHAIAQVISGENQPKIIKKFEEKILNPGDNVHLECEATSNPIAKITWSLDDQNLSTVDVSINERKENADTIVSELILKKVTVENGGVYRCAATNEAGSDSFGARVNIYGKLGMRTMLQKTVVAGENFIVTCPYFGYPVSSLKWHKDSEILPIMFHQTVHENGSLSVSNVKKELHASDCISILSNRTFSVAPKIMPFSFQEDLLREGMRARLQCVVSEGDSPITIQWLKDNAIIPAELNINIQQIDEFSSILNIGQVTPKHNGNYTCKTRNAATTAAYSAILNVNVPPKIIPFAFVDDQFYKGMRAHITCAVSQGDPPLNFRWLKDDRPITSSSADVLTQQYDKYANSLSIESVSSVHTGNYTCVVSNRAVTVSHTAQLLVHAAPKIIPFSFQDDQLFVGVFARVSCVVYQGDLPITIQWSKDNHPLSTLEGVNVRQVDQFSSMLTIEKVQQVHSGNYTCTATNSAASASSTAILVVNVPPKIVPFTFQDGHLLEGMLVRVSCVVSRGDLPLNISWLKDNKVASQESSISVHNLDDYSSVLSIDPVTKKHDGNYTCVAKNMAGTDIFVASITVNELPKWVVKPNNTKIPIGRPAVMSCLTTGFPKPITTWYKVKGSDAQGVKNMVQNGNGYNLVKNGSLKIDHVNLQHAGYYFCLSNNTIGSISAMALLSITVPPQIHKKFQNNTVRKNDAVLFKCVAHGDRPMTFTWFANGQPITRANKMDGYLINQANDTGSETSEFAINKAERKDSTTFVCSVENSYGMENATFNLLKLPMRRKKLELIEANNRTVVVGWSEPYNGNSPINKYILQYKLTTDKWESGVRNLTLPGRKLQSAISNLKPSIDYHVRVIAANDIGLGLPSKEIQVLMPD
uniref:Down syndrome cell adhesion molecule-like protein Dscam2 n=1 Tax=Strigamia maritima TaxID=126957 RepID=T1IM02_STRMM